jgi:hypothetical protein
LKPTGTSPTSSSSASSPNCLNCQTAHCGVGVGVGARLAAAEPVARVVVPRHHPVVGGPELHDLLNDRIVLTLPLDAADIGDERKQDDRDGQ